MRDARCLRADGDAPSSGLCIVLASHPRGCTACPAPPSMKAARDTARREEWSVVDLRRRAVSRLVASSGELRGGFAVRHCDRARAGRHELEIRGRRREGRPREEAQGAPRGAAAPPPRRGRRLRRVSPRVRGVHAPRRLRARGGCDARQEEGGGERGAEARGARPADGQGVRVQHVQAREQIDRDPRGGRRQRSRREEGREIGRRGDGSADRGRDRARVVDAARPRTRPEPGRGPGRTRGQARGRGVRPEVLVVRPKRRGEARPGALRRGLAPAAGGPGRGGRRERRPVRHRVERRRRVTGRARRGRVRSETPRRRGLRLQDHTADRSPAGAVRGVAEAGGDPRRGSRDAGRGSSAR